MGGVVRGLWPALVCAAMSFLLVDYFFAHQLGGEFTRLEGRNVAAMLAHYISETEATEVVIGHRRRARWRPWDTTSELIRRLAGWTYTSSEYANPPFDRPLRRGD